MLSPMTSRCPRPTRRRFLRHSALAAGSALAFPAVVRGRSLNERLRVAAVGVGGFGYRTFTSVASHEKADIVALCDVDAGHLERAAKEFPDAARHRDWRALLADMGDGFDAVTVAIPDHMHAPVGLSAIRAGKHVYVQKPLAPTVHECRVLAREAKSAGVITQLGNQKRSSAESRTAVELLRRGAIGKIKEVLIWENKPLNWWPKNTELRPQGDPVPGTLEWDLWLGVREPRPYLRDTYHPTTWRAWFDFGVGEFGDMGCHHFDESVDGLRLAAPLRVRQTTPGSEGPLWGKRRRVELVFPGSEATADDELRITWHDGDLRPDAERIPLPDGVEELPESGTCWIGEKGAMFKNFREGMPVLLPESSFSGEEIPEGIASGHHYHDWVDAVLEGGKAVSDFEHGARLTEIVLVGSYADRHAEQWLEWDSEAMRFPDVEEANQLVRRDYREGWRIEGLG